MAQALPEGEIEEGALQAFLEKAMVLGKVACTQCQVQRTG